MKRGPTHRLDDLRRFAIGLATASGLAPTKAATLAGHLLWLDVLGATGQGLGALGGWLDRLAAGEFDPRDDGSVGRERAAVAVLDARRGLPPLAIARAGELAAEKAREAGLGLVRVVGLADPGPAGPLALELAVGPYLGLAIGPDGRFALALPTAGGAPHLLDPRLATPSKAIRPAEIGVWESIVPAGDWLVAAIGVGLFGSEAFLDRAGDPAAGWITSAEFERRRTVAADRGLAIDPAVWSDLSDRAGRIGVVVPGVAAR